MIILLYTSAVLDATRFPYVDTRSLWEEICVSTLNALRVVNYCVSPSSVTNCLTLHQIANNLKR